jgi:hypothetical protein
MSTTKPEVVFVNNLSAWGFLNGVLNLAFSTAQFLPQVVEDEENEGQYVTKVMTAEVVTANLRMDLLAAQQLRSALDQIIEANTKPKVMDS